MTLTKRQTKKLIGLAISLISLGVAYAYRQPLAQQTQAVVQNNAGSDYNVTEVVDGDTIKVSMNGKTETVRYIGVDTPETHDPRKSVQCFGQAAAAYNKSLVEGKQVRLETDPNDSDRDKYGRLLRYIYVGDTLVNAKLINDGYAFAYVVFPFTKLDEFRGLEQQAREAKRGLWNSCSVDESNKIKQTNNQ